MNHIVGDLDAEKANQALHDLGFTQKEDDIIVPRRRSPKDITLPADVAEEAIRIV